MKKFLKTLGITTLAQMVQWLLFIQSDYIVETYDEGELFFAAVIFPIVLSIIYIISDKYETQKIKRFIMNAGIWIVEDIIICSWVWKLIEAGKWFIVQGEGILNGAEYFYMPIYWTIIPIIIVLVWKIIYFIYKKIKLLIKK